MDKPRVKPLVWEPRSSGFWVATTNFGGHYIISQYAGMPQPFKLEGQGFWNVRCGYFEAIETAKAAAQADYEARILAALEPVTVQDAARVLLGGDFSSPMLDALDPYNNDVDVWDDVTNALRALAERGE